MVVVVLTPEKIAYTSDLGLDWAAPSWLSTGVKLQSPNKDYANWNMENNKQLRPLYQMETFSDFAVTSSPNALQ